MMTNTKDRISTHFRPKPDGLGSASSYRTSNGRWILLFNRLIAAYPAFFILEDERFNRETARLLWKKKHHDRSDSAARPSASA
jgi:hypothetical protein